MDDIFCGARPADLAEENCESNRRFNVHNSIALHRAHFEKVGLGADYVKTLFR